jgi:hypothetical protein
MCCEQQSKDGTSTLLWFPESMDWHCSSCILLRHNISVSIICSSEISYDEKLSRRDRDSGQSVHLVHNWVNHFSIRTRQDIILMRFSYHTSGTSIMGNLLVLLLTHKVGHHFSAHAMQPTESLFRKFGQKVIYRNSNEKYALGKVLHLHNEISKNSSILLDLQQVYACTKTQGTRNYRIQFQSICS